MISMLVLSFHKNLHLVLALISLTAGSAGVAIADVTIDACVAQNSNLHPSLAADMQSLCALSSSVGSLVGFSISGIFVHLIGPTVSYYNCSLDQSFPMFSIACLHMKNNHLTVGKVFSCVPCRGCLAC